MDRTPSALRLVAPLAAAMLLAAPPAAAQDSDLFNLQVAPNVVFVFDNSQSMNNVVWHPAYVPGVVYDPVTCPYIADPEDPDYDPKCLEYPLCEEFSDEVSTDDGFTTTECGNTRTVFADPEVEDANNDTIWSEEYLEWYFSENVEQDHDGDGNTILDEILATDNGVHSQCLIDQGKSATYSLYRRARITAAKDITREVICRTAQVADIRYGLARFYTERFWIFLLDPDGGYVNVGVDDYDDDQADALEAGIESFEGESFTPLAETLYNVYRFFQSRGSGEQAVGKDGSTLFPVYNIGTNGSTSSGTIPPSPVEYPCQLNFVVMITDGEPTGDDFSDMERTQFLDDLIGDYHDDGEVEEGYALDGTLYLDDVAKFMQDQDFLPDDTNPNFPGVQNVDVYTVGFTTNAFANALLEKTADVANGEFFFSNNAEELTDALTQTINDIVNKAQSFTAATIPVSRVEDGNSFYATYFLPRLDDPFWEGHLKSFDFTAGGDILTPDGNCATGDDPTAEPPCPSGGTLRVIEDGFWDAATAMPDPADRRLYYEAGGTGELSQPPAFTIATGQEDAFAAVLGITTADASDEPYASLSPNAPGDMAVALVDVLRGCQWGSSPCEPRVNPNSGAKTYLGDIFHSNPVIVGSPAQPINEGSYQLFAKNNRERTNVIYAGANDGFLHAFVAGHWDDSLQPPRHDRGNVSPLANGGQELFGFIPAPVRDRIKDLPKENVGLRESVYVDGPPVVFDMWMYRTYASGSLNTTVDALLPDEDFPKDPLQWRTVLIGGLRDGGEGYYALDVTEPPAEVSTATSSYPLYLWGFPCDDCSNALNGSTSGEAPYVARTWSKPIITRVRVMPENGTRPGGYERWVAVFGAGYHEEGDPNSSGYAAGSLKGRALYMLDITTGEVLAKKVFDPIASAFDGSVEQVGIREMQYAIASSPAVFDLDFDGFADVIYVGDLGGNLWKWVVSDVGKDPVNSSSGVKAAYLAQPDWPFRRVFRAGTSLEPTLPPEQTGGAYDDTVHYQSFFSPPAGVLRQGKLVLAFGAGERANPIGPDALWGDGDDDNNNHYYVVKDNDPLERVGSPPHPIDDSIVEADLLTQAALALLVADLDVLDTQRCSTVYGSALGYYLTGRDAEKFITTTVIEKGGRLTTGSFLPPDPNDANACEASGDAFVYELHVECSVGFDADGNPDPDAALYRWIGEGMPADPRYSTSNLGGGDDDDEGGGGCPNKLITMTSGGSMDASGSDECIHGIEIRGWRQR